MSSKRLNPFVPIAPFEPFDPIEPLENLTVFRYFQRVEKRCIGNKWIKYILFVIPEDVLIKMLRRRLTDVLLKDLVQPNDLLNLTSIF